MFTTIQSQPSQASQPFEHPGKILICDMNNSQGNSLQLFLKERGFKNVVFQADITELKKKAFYYKPDVIISENHLWEDTPGIDFIVKLRLQKYAHIIIWSDSLNNRLLSFQFKYRNLHFIKRTNHENVLIETIRKVIPVY
jgi:DNA-binding NtrC family response regulator